VSRAWRGLFGTLFEGDVLDDRRARQHDMMPTIVIGCGLVLTAIFLPSVTRFSPRYTTFAAPTLEVSLEAKAISP